MKVQLQTNYLTRNNIMQNRDKGPYINPTFKSTIHLLAPDNAHLLNYFVARMWSFNPTAIIKDADSLKMSFPKGKEADILTSLQDELTGRWNWSGYHSPNDHSLKAEALSAIDICKPELKVLSKSELERQEKKVRIEEFFR